MSRQDWRDRRDSIEGGAAGSLRAKDKLLQLPNWAEASSHTEELFCWRTLRQGAAQSREQGFQAFKFNISALRSIPWKKSCLIKPYCLRKFFMWRQKYFSIIFSFFPQFSLQHMDFSSWGSTTHRLSCSITRAILSFPSREWTHIPFTGRRILNQWTTGAIPLLLPWKQPLICLLLKNWKLVLQGISLSSAKGKLRSSLVKSRDFTTFSCFCKAGWTLLNTALKNHFPSFTTTSYASGLQAWEWKWRGEERAMVRESWRTRRSEAVNIWATAEVKPMPGEPRNSRWKGRPQNAWGFCSDMLISSPPLSPGQQGDPSSHLHLGRLKKSRRFLVRTRLAVNRK